MNYKIISISFIFLFIINIYSIGQIDINEIHFSIEEPKNPYFKADTSNYYLIFEYQFDNDSVTIYNNTKIVFKGTLYYTDLFSKEINLGKFNDIEFIYMKLNDYPKLKFQMIQGKYYVRISLYSGVLSLCYSKFPPRYK